jgi:hypothetical protein
MKKQSFPAAFQLLYCMVMKKLAKKAYLVSAQVFGGLLAISAAIVLLMQTFATFYTADGRASDLFGFPTPIRPLEYEYSIFSQITNLFTYWQHYASGWAFMFVAYIGGRVWLSAYNSKRQTQIVKKAA